MLLLHSCRPDRAHSIQAQLYLKWVLSHTTSLHQPIQVATCNSVNNEDANNTQFGPLKKAGRLLRWGPTFTHILSNKKNSQGWTYCNPDPRALATMFTKWNEKPLIHEGVPVYPAHSSLTFHRNELLSCEHNSLLPRTADKEAPVSTLSFRAKSALSKPETRRVKVIFTVLKR